MRRQYFRRGWDYRDLDTPTTNSFMGPEQMANHAIGRLRFSLVAGTDLALLRTSGLLAAGTPITTTPARAQDDTGHNGWQASHVLPCGLAAAGTAIHQICRPPLRAFLADPYRSTNVVPRAVNTGDRRVEAFRQSEGKGLINAFGWFARYVVLQTATTHKSLDKGLLQSAYATLFRDYLQSFEGLIGSFREHQIAGRTTGFGGTDFDFATFAPTRKEINEEDVRTSLRLQLKAMRDLGGCGFSSQLVDEVESDFHRVLAASDVSK